MGKFEYAPAPESRDIVALRESYGLFIDGEFVPGKGDGVFKTISPGHRRGAGRGHRGQRRRR